MRSRWRQGPGRCQCERRRTCLKTCKEPERLFRPCLALFPVMGRSRREANSVVCNAAAGRRPTWQMLESSVVASAARPAPARSAGCATQLSLAVVWARAGRRCRQAVLLRLPSASFTSSRTVLQANGSGARVCDPFHAVSPAPGMPSASTTLQAARRYPARLVLPPSQGRRHSLCRRIRTTQSHASPNVWN